MAWYKPLKKKLEVAKVVEKTRERWNIARVGVCTSVYVRQAGESGAKMCERVLINRLAGEESGSELAWRWTFCAYI